MKLPAIPFLTKTVATEFFLSLIFESDKISSILFKEQEKTLVILASYESPIDLEGASVEDMVVASDTVISRLEMSLPEGAVLEKTIFAVPHSWVEEGKIKAERLNQLKRISEELALTPMGFIVSIEAIIAYLQKKEGAPVSGIFVDIGERTLSAFIVRSGNIIDIQQGVIQEGVEKTVERLLGQVTRLDVLPSKIVILHNKEAEEVSQKLLSHHWTKELPFMHLPQVAILDKGFENEAIINGVATQLNVSIKGAIPTAKREQVVAAGGMEAASESTDTFGFVMDEDVAIAKEVPEEESPPSPKEDGFEFTEEESREEPKEGEEGGEEVFEEDEERHAGEKPSGGGILGMLAAFLTPQTLASIPKKIGNGRKLIIPFAALFVVALLLTAYYTAILKAKITIFTGQKAFAEDSLAITLTTNGNSSFEDKVLKISTVNEEVDGEETQETTGKKETGEKAKGTITLFNKSEGSRKIDKGTTVVSSNNLEFTLDGDVNIASTSSFSTSFASAQVKVTASEFGKEYNLPSQTNFTVKGVPTSTVFGRNDAAFSGGTKEEVQVVAKKDLQALDTAITKNLFEKAKSQAEGKLTGADALIPNYLSLNFVEKNYDKKENDEASSVKLAATIDYTMGIYKKDELSNFIASSNSFDVPSDFKLSDDSSITLSEIEQDGEDISGRLSFNAIFKPQLEMSNLSKDLSGKSREQAIEKLKTISGISDATIQFTSAIPFLPVILPLNEANITVEQKVAE